MVTQAKIWETSSSLNNSKIETQSHTQYNYAKKKREAFYFCFWIEEQFLQINMSDTTMETLT